MDWGGLEFWIGMLMGSGMSTLLWIAVFAYDRAGRRIPMYGVQCRRCHHRFVIGHPEPDYVCGSCEVDVRVETLPLARVHGYPPPYLYED